MEILFDFLHYTSKKRLIKPFYLKLLKTILREQSVSLSSITFPEFCSYKKIEQIRVYTEHISFRWWNIDEDIQKQILTEIEDCFRENRPYTDDLKLLDDKLLKDSTLTEINQLLKSWHLNKKLREFLQSMESFIDSIKCYVSFNRITIDRQQFIRELNDDHHRIEIKSRHVPIDRVLLWNARRKYCEQHTNNLIHLKQSAPIVTEKRPFPDEIFPSTKT